MSRYPAAASRRRGNGYRARPADTGSGKPTLDVAVVSAVKPLVASGMAWQDAEVIVLKERREQRRAEIHALNALLKSALTGSENDP